MPTGGWQCYNHVLKTLSRFTRVNNPPRHSLLDIGIGGGRWGYVFRDVMEWRADRYFEKDWVCEVHGIEAFPQYRNPVWDYAYNRIWTGLIQDQIDNILAFHKKPYSFITCMDVIEHMPKETGVALVDKLVKNCTEVMFIAFPDASNPERALRQGTVHGNVHETHHALWSVAKDLAPRYQVLDVVADSFAVIKGQA